MVFSGIFAKAEIILLNPPGPVKGKETGPFSGMETGNKTAGRIKEKGEQGQRDFITPRLSPFFPLFPSRWHLAVMQGRDSILI
jgi:hypothetical protein